MVFQGRPIPCAGVDGRGPLRSRPRRAPVGEEEREVGGGPTGVGGPGAEKE